MSQQTNPIHFLSVRSVFDMAAFGQPDSQPDQKYPSRKFVFSINWSKCTCCCSISKYQTLKMEIIFSLIPISILLFWFFFLGTSFFIWSYFWSQYFYLWRPRGVTMKFLKISGVGRVAYMGTILGVICYHYFNWFRYNNLRKIYDVTMLQFLSINSWHFTSSRIILQDGLSLIYIL